MRTNFLINGQQIKSPNQFKIELYKITESSRVASGLMMMELIAKKHKFYLTYDALSSSDMNDILRSLWDNNEVFYTFSYIEDNQRKSAKVYVGAIPKELHYTSNSEWVWKNVTFSLIEQ